MNARISCLLAGLVIAALLAGPGCERGAPLRTDADWDEPFLVGLYDFNREDVEGVWGDIAPPEWSIDAETFREFASELDR